MTNSVGPFSPNKGGVRPQTQFIILHYTVGRPMSAVRNHFMDPTSKVSCHYMIDEGGVQDQIVEEDRVAWHAGVSDWDGWAAKFPGADTLNPAAIGIELVYVPNETENLMNKMLAPDADLEAMFPPFPDAQMDQLKKLVLGLQEKYGILNRHILGHNDIAVGRKQDPGAAFPWGRFRENGWGLYSLLPKENRHGQIQRWQDFYEKTPPSDQQLDTWIQKIGYRYMGHVSAVIERKAAMLTFRAHMGDGFRQKPDSFVWACLHLCAAAAAS